MREAGLPEPSLVVDSGGESLHFYWLFDQGFTDAAVWQADQKRLAEHLGSDPGVIDPSRVMRLPGAWYATGEGQFQRQCRIVHHIGRRYTREQILASLPPVASTPPLTPQQSSAQPPASTPTEDAGRTRRRILDQLQRIPPRVPGTGTRDNYLKLLWAMADALGDANAAAHMAAHSPLWAQAEDLRKKCQERKGSVGVASFFQLTRDKWGITDPPRAAVARGVEAVAAAAEQPQGQQTTDALTYSQLIEATLRAARKNIIDDEMYYRAELKARFRCTNGEIVQALFDRLAEEEIGNTTPAAYGDMDLFEHGDEVDWRVQGYLHCNDQTMIAGANGQGKTRAIIEMGFAIVDGLPFLDRSAPAVKGNVLYILSDGGTATFKGEVLKAGYQDHPALKRSGDGHNIKFMAHSAKANTRQWSVSISGCLYLLDYIRKNNIDVVFIDSIKTVCASGTVSYTDNEGVRALLTFFKNVICQHCSVVWINHDGFNGEPTAGAKSWREVPSSWHQITPATKKEPGSKGKPVLVPNRKEWHVRKMRVEETRSFHYGIGPDQRLFVDADFEILGNCKEQIVQLLRKAELDGKKWLLTKNIVEGITTYTVKTVRNTLSVESSVSSPLIQHVGSSRYSLTTTGRDLADSLIAGDRSQDLP